MDDQPGPPRNASAVPFAELNWKAIAFGIFTDIFGTGLMSLLLFMVLGARLVSPDMANEEVAQALVDSNAYLFLSFAGGLACTVLGGFIAARIAGRLEYFHGLFTGLGVLIFGELMMLNSPGEYGLALRIVGDLLLVPAALVGAHLRKRAREAPPPG